MQNAVHKTNIGSSNTCAVLTSAASTLNSIPTTFSCPSAHVMSLCGHFPAVSFDADLIKVFHRFLQCGSACGLESPVFNRVGKNQKLLALVRADFFTVSPNFQYQKIANHLICCSMKCSVFIVY